MSLKRVLSLHPRAALTLIFLGISAVVVGCNFAPKYSRPSTSAPPAFKENWKTAEPSDHALRGKWWEMYNDPELSALEEQVNVSNQNIASAVASYFAARALVRQARSQLFPTVGVGPSVNHSRTSSSSPRVITPSVGGSLTGTNLFATTTVGSGQSITTYSIPFDATWQPDFWGAVRNSVRASSFAAQASAAMLENVRLTAQAEVAIDYYQLRGQDSLIALYRSNVVAYEKALDLTRTLFATGIDSGQAVALAETQLETVRAQAMGLETQRAQLEHAIAVLIGKPPSTFSISAREVNVTPPEIPVGIPSQLLERRPDIAASERTVAQANAQIGVARAAYFPNVTINPSAGLQSTSISSLFSGFFWSIGGNVSETLFDAGRRSGVTEQTWANYQQTVAAYRQTVLTAFQEVEDDLAALRILDQQLRQQQIAIEASERNLNLENQRFSTGIDSYLNVVTAQTTLLNNQQAAVSIRTQRMVASAQLIEALGGGWSTLQLPAE